MGKLSHSLTGIAGEYFVAAELSRRGYIASVNLKNTQGIDILASNGNATRQVAIQVKTNQGDNLSWMLNEKCEELHSDNLFYVFVNLKGKKQRPDFYIVPSSIVAKHIRQGYKEWHDALGRHGQPHSATPMRKFSDKKQKYLEMWEILGLG